MDEIMKPDPHHEYAMKFPWNPHEIPSESR